MNECHLLMVEFLAEESNMRVDGVGERIGFHVPYRFEYHLAREHYILVLHEIFEQGEFLIAELYGLFVERDNVSYGIQR